MGQAPRAPRRPKADRLRQRSCARNRASMKAFARSSGQQVTRMPTSFPIRDACLPSDYFSLRPRRPCLAHAHAEQHALIARSPAHTRSHDLAALHMLRPDHAGRQPTAGKSCTLNSPRTRTPRSRTPIATSHRCRPMSAPATHAAIRTPRTYSAKESVARLWPAPPSLRHEPARANFCTDDNRSKPHAPRTPEPKGAMATRLLLLLSPSLVSGM